MHTSYPYGNPLKLSHPAALGTYPFGLGDAHLYSELVYEPGGAQLSIMSSHSYTNAQAQSQSALRWNDMALDELLPADPKRVAAERAARARKGATGAQNSAPAPPPEQPQGDGIGPGGEQQGDMTGGGLGDTTGPTATSDGEDDDEMGMDDSF